MCWRLAKAMSCRKCGGSCNQEGKSLWICSSCGATCQNTTERENLVAMSALSPYEILSLLVKKLGGKVEITNQEYREFDWDNLQLVDGIDEEYTTVVYLLDTSNVKVNFEQKSSERTS